MTSIKQYLKSKYQNDMLILFIGSFDNNTMTLDIGLLKVLLRLKGIKENKNIDNIINKITER